MTIEEKLRSIGDIYYINLDSDVERKEYMESQFKKYNIKNYTRIPGFDARNSNINEILSGETPPGLSLGEIGCSVSHLKAIKTWYENSNSSYAVIMEDDLMFDLVEYWTFTWEEFYNLIPYDWDIVQISIISVDKLSVYLHKRFINDFSTACYLINRNYAKKLIDLHTVGEKFKLDNGCKPRAVADDMIYNAGNTYSIPLLLADIKFDSSIHQHHIKLAHEVNYEVINHIWKTHSEKIDINNIMVYNEQLLHYWQKLSSKNIENNTHIATELEKAVVNVNSYYHKFLKKD